MPDAGRFDRDNHPPPPPDWASAFAALPLEAPDAHGWQRVRNQLPAAAPIVHRRWPAWLAVAASLALAVAIPLQRSPAPQATVARTAAATTPAETDIARTAVPTRTMPVDAVTADAAPAPARDARLATTVPATGPVVRARLPARAPRAAPVQPLIRPLAPSADSTMLARNDAELEALQGQSAQLESLLMLARDERVSSGTPAVLSDALDAQVASIDAALIQPGLAPAQRAALWSERVDALQQLAGIETTNRLYAARGQDYDVALVSVH